MKKKPALLPISLINIGTPGLRPLEGNIEGKYVVIRPERLKERMRFARNQLLLAAGGFGCHESNSGSKVYGKHLDGEEAQWRREDFIGIASKELVERAKVDKSEESPIDISLRVYMAVGPGFFAKAPTIAGALEALGKRMLSRKKLRLGQKGVMVFECHPEAYINDMAMLVSPKGAPSKEVK